MTHDPENAPGVEPPSVEQQRADLAATVEALAAKADVPTRVADAATEQAHRLKDAATEQAHQLKDAATVQAAHLKGAASQQSRNLQDRPEIIAAAAVGVAVAVALILGIRRRRSSRNSSDRRGAQGPGSRDRR